MMSWPLFQNAYILRKPRATISAEMIKILSMFIKTIFKDSKSWIGLKHLNLYAQSYIFFTTRFLPTYLFEDILDHLIYYLQCWL